MYETIKNFPDYELSPTGKIRKQIKKDHLLKLSNEDLKWTTYEDKELKPRINRNGLKQITLSYSWKDQGIFIERRKKTFLIHCLVAEYFIDNPNNYKHVIHIDKNKLNNHYTNLKYVSLKDYIKHYKTVEWK
jgi:hypothetical protein